MDRYFGWRIKYKDFKYYYEDSITRKCNTNYCLNEYESYRSFLGILRQYRRKKDRRFLELVLHDQINNCVFGDIKSDDLINIYLHSIYHDFTAIKMIVATYASQDKLITYGNMTSNIYYSNDNKFIMDVVELMIAYDQQVIIDRSIFNHLIWIENEIIIKFLIKLLTLGKIELDVTCSEMFSSYARRGIKFIDNKWNMIKLLFDYHCEHRFINIHHLIDRLITNNRYKIIKLILDNYAGNIKNDIDGREFSMILKYDSDAMIELFSNHGITITIEPIILE